MGARGGSPPEIFQPSILIMRRCFVGEVCATASGAYILFTVILALYFLA
jgi:hypothetical protein